MLTVAGWYAQAADPQSSSRSDNNSVEWIEWFGNESGQSLKWDEISESSHRRWIECIYGVERREHKNDTDEQWFRPSVYQQCAMPIGCIYLKLSSCSLTPHSFWRAHTYIIHSVTPFRRVAFQRKSVTENALQLTIDGIEMVFVGSAIAIQPKIYSL